MPHRVAHIVNPFNPPQGSDLCYAQPITLETMRIARQNAGDKINIEFLAAFYPEDENTVPDFFDKKLVLGESVLDKGTFKKKIKLPLIREILELGFKNSDAEYIMYSNIDIGLYPDFYLRLNTLLNEGHDALIINRQRIEPLYTTPGELDKIWTQKGKSHPGFDCFIFRRKLFPKFRLENICIGVPFIEIGFSQNLFHLAENFQLIETDFYTFHIGMEIFKNRAPKEFFNYNRKEFHKAEKQLYSFMKLKNLPFSNIWLPFRIIKWGLHPCIPIRLALKLVWKDLFKS